MLEWFLGLVGMKGLGFFFFFLIYIDGRLFSDGVTTNWLFFGVSFRRCDSSLSSSKRDMDILSILIGSVNAIILFSLHVCPLSHTMAELCGRCF